MSNEMISVPRELLERVTGVTARNIEDAVIAGSQLRALLAKPGKEASPGFKKIEMAHVVNALEDVRGNPVLTSNQCHDLAWALNDRLLSPLQLLSLPHEYVAVAQHPGQPILIQAVAVTRQNDDGMYLEWLLEGGICEMEFPGQVLFAMPDANDLCDEDGSAEVYIIASS